MHPLFGGRTRAQCVRGHESPPEGGGISLASISETTTPRLKPGRVESKLRSVLGALSAGVA
jgi:hypothetical protein